MSQGIADCATWMEDFLDAYDAWWVANGGDDDKVIPARFHFDVEEHVAVIGNANYSYLLERTSLDPRWSDPAFPIRGFSKTGQELWTEVASVYGWPANVADALNSGEPNWKQDSNAVPPYDNQKPYVWWQEICTRAIEAAMDEAAYSVIRAHDPSEPRWAQVKCSDYHAGNLDGQPEALFGWHQVRLFGDANRSPTPPANPVWRRADKRAQPDEFSAHGAHPSALVDPALVPGEVVVVDGVQPILAHWSNITRSRYGDFSAPPLYAVGKDDRYRNPVVYMKLNPWDHDKDPTTPDEAKESRWMASMRINRQIAEGMIATDSKNLTGGDDASSFAPWVQTPNTSWAGADDVNIDDSDRFFVEDFRNLLAMLRAKDVKELKAYNATGCAYRFPPATPQNPNPAPELSCYNSNQPGVPPAGWSDQWTRFIEEYEGVYGPRVVSFEAGLGTVLGDQFGAANDPERLWFTLPRKVDGVRAEYTANIESKKPFWVPAGAYVTMFPAVSELEVVFEGVSGGNYTQMQLNIEAEVKATAGMPVSRNGDGQATTFRGQVYCKDWLTGQFVDVTRTSTMSAEHPEVAYEGGGEVCEECLPDPVQYGFYTPGGPGQPEAQDATRRFFLIPHTGSFGGQLRNVVSSSGQVRIKLVHLLYEAQPTPDLNADGMVDAAFTSKYDLVQLVNIFTGFTELAESEGAPQGADIDYSGAADGADAALFVTEWFEGTSVADFDQSGTVDTDDIVQFFEALNAAGQSN